MNAKVYDLFFVFVLAQQAAIPNYTDVSCGAVTYAILMLC